MEKNKDIFYFSGTHWDREWYQTFQGFRYRLVKAMDGILDGMRTLDDFNVFHLDGQTIVLEDYAEIKPENAEALKEFIKNDRIKIGPWYDMPDEFILSGESLIRNLMMGHELSKKWGAKEAWKFGYICDIFGHIAQMPQIFNGFDINYSYQCRGYYAYTPPYFRWKSPDGSETINFRIGNENGYGEFCCRVLNQFTDKTTDEEKQKMIEDYVDWIIEKADPQIPVYVISDALDHHPLHRETGEYIEIIKNHVPDANVHHVDLMEAAKLLENYRSKMNVVEGELNKTNKIGFPDVITNTVSSYYPLKKANDECQNMLEKVIEPMLAYSAINGNVFERNYVKLAYKYLIQNHPHDSICGCSIDQVHKDMEYRFDQTKEICEELKDDYVLNNSKTHMFERDGETDAILTLHNPLPFDRDEVVTVDLNMKPNYPKQYAEPFGYEHINSFRIIDFEGNEIPYQVKAIKRNQNQRVFDQKCELADVHTVTFKAFVPAGGKSEYRIVPSELPSRYLKHMKSGSDYMENELVRVEINPNGTLVLLDKKTGKIYDNQLTLVDDSEIGDGWYHASSKDNKTVFSSFGNCYVEKIESGVSRCVFRITKELRLPKCNVMSRATQERSSEYEMCTAVFEVGLSEGNRFVDVKLDFSNNVKDHRLRIAMPTYTYGDKYFAGQAFYCCERNVGIDYSTQDWKEPEQYEKAMNGIMGKRDASGNGLAFVSAKGLHECGSTDDEEATMYVTLLRGFRKTVMTNGQIRGQLLGEHTYNFVLAPVDESVSYSDLVHIQDRLAVNCISSYTEVTKDTETASPISNFKLSGDNICLSVIKCAEREDSAYAVRMFNASDKASTACMEFAKNISDAKEVNLNEEYKAVSNVKIDANKALVEVEPWKIVTVMVKF